VTCPLPHDRLRSLLAPGKSVTCPLTHERLRSLLAPGESVTRSLAHDRLRSFVMTDYGNPYPVDQPADRSEHTVCQRTGNRCLSVWLPGARRRRPTERRGRRCAVGKVVALGGPGPAPAADGSVGPCTAVRARGCGSAQRRTVPAATPRHPRRARPFLPG
jgi:hypothetical protein